MDKKPIAILVLVLILLLNACSPAPAYDPDLLLTLTPLSESVRTTLTARAGEAAVEENSLATTVVKATQQAEVVYATQTQRAALYEPSRLMTATAEAPIAAEIPEYGVSMDEGQTAWIHKPVLIELSGFQQADFASDYPTTTAADFVIASDITWNSKNSLGGCGYVFRSDGEPKEPTQYMLIVERSANGRIIFAATVKGELSNYHEFYPKEKDPSFDWSNYGTNRFTLVVRGDLIDIYTNGALIDQLNIKDEPVPVTMPPLDLVLPAGATPEQIQAYQEEVEKNKLITEQAFAKVAEASRNFRENSPFFYDGLIGFFASSDSGTLSCEFTNGWLFKLNPQ